MSCDPKNVSPCGTWELRRTSSGGVNEGGYGSSSWEYQLIERATGAVVATWGGYSSQSTWDGWSSGVADVRWDGEELVVSHCPEHLHAEPVVERVRPASLPTP
jgi:hypothetical protein